MKKPNNISRRNFLKGAAASALGAAAFSVMGTPAAQAESAQAANTPANYEVINSDLIIVGAGNGATFAALEAIRKGQRVTIIEKAPFRHGGAWGYNWDLCVSWVRDAGNYAQESFFSNVNVVNQKLFVKAVKSEDDEHPDGNTDVDYLNLGQIIADRDETGAVIPYGGLDYPFIKCIDGVFPRLLLDEIIKSPLVTVVDNTMVIDLLINDKRCLGVMGLYLPTGDMRVFRAPATIVATGPSTWIYGWTGVSAYTFGTPDNTGDVEMALYRRGGSIGDNEYASYDFCTTYPQGLGYGWGTILNPDSVEIGAFADRNGEQLFTPERIEESGIDPLRMTVDRTYFNSTIGKMMVAGAATDEGGLLANLNGVHLRTVFKVSNLKNFEVFDVDPYAQHLPIHDEIYERGGTPVVDENLMVEDCEGLFWIRGAGTSGTNGGNMAQLNTRFGKYAAKRAMDYLSNCKPTESIDWSSVEEEYARIHELRTREIKDGIRPCVIRHRIQNTCGTCLGIVRTKENLQAALAELKRIRDEDMPKMVVTNKTLTQNNEWKEAIENFNLLDCALLAVEASLLREETRGQYLRVEFPEINDADWKCMLSAKKVDGEAVFTKREMPTASY